MDALLARLLHRNQKVSDEAVAKAVASGADKVLGQALQQATGWKRVIFAAALGDLRCPGPSDPLLRQAATAEGAGTRDLRCASLLALAKRLDSAATPDLRDALGQRDFAVREYAIMALAAVGDDTAWLEVLAWLDAQKTPSRVAFDPPTSAAVHYLLRHVRLRSDADRRDLAQVLRKRWTLLERDGVATWLASVWPGVSPGREIAADPGLPRPVDPDEWRRNPLLAAPATG